MWLWAVFLYRNVGVIAAIYFTVKKWCKNVKKQFTIVLIFFLFLYIIE